MGLHRIQRRKRIWKIVGIVFLFIVVVIGGFMGFIQVRGIPSYDVHVPQVPQVAATPERIVQGKKISDMLCRNCHYNAETGKFTGKEIKGLPQFGRVYSRNLTNSKDNGIGDWSDAEIIYLIRTGIQPKTGQYLPPYMPKLTHISDEDLRSVIAYLRSDAPELQASTIEMPPTDPSFLTKLLTNLVFKPYPYPEHEILGPDTTNKVEWGKYLAVYQIECFTCHSGDFTKLDMQTPENSYLYFAGGNELLNSKGEKIITQNLTPDSTTGIGSWTEDQFVRALRGGIPPDGHALREPMRPFAELTDTEARAIYAYLRTVPAIKNRTPRGI